MRTVALDLGARRVDSCEVTDGGVIERGVVARQIARRRGARIAVVALARRLAGVLWAVWRDDTVYDPHRVGLKSAQGVSRHAHEREFQAQALRAAANKAATRVRLAHRTLEASGKDSQ